MLPNEKDKLLAFFESDRRWCQDAEARDAYGNAVKFHDPLAAAWDITGAICCLFGWKRACTLFGQLERHIHRRRGPHGFKRDAAIESMVTLQAYNDCPETAFEVIFALFETMPVWNRTPCPSNASARPIESRCNVGPPLQHNGCESRGRGNGGRCQSQESMAGSAITWSARGRGLEV